MTIRELVREMVRPMKFELRGGSDGPRTWGPDVNNARDVMEMITEKKPSFIQCLHVDDQRTFLKWYADLIVASSVSAARKQEIIDSRGILICVWLQGMEQLSKNGSLKHSYFLYRQAFWGENRTGKKTCSLTTRYSVSLRQIITVPSSVSTVILVFQNNQFVQRRRDSISELIRWDAEASKQVLNSPVF